MSEKPDLLRFGAFEADLSTGELRKNGTRIRLAPQAFRVLEALAQKPGELITREELRAVLWPNETVVEFDHSINTAVKRIRAALNDSSIEPRYIETLARRGYRFVAEVEQISRPSRPEPPPAEVPDSAGLPRASDWTDPIGTVISHYRILSVLGQGGMGIVYRAEDIRLQRPVALKFQPPELELDPVARERFEREARSASSLNHPNICTVYEVDTFEGRTFIALELLEGETLAQRMARAPASERLSTSNVIDIAIAVSDALEAAHEIGIIHRDIKPGNVFLTQRGKVKVLDFGLAKLDFGLAKGGARRRISDLVTAGDEQSEHWAALTRTHDTPGTAAYMSPEQARGEELDARSDLYSLGVVLYECATGRLAGAISDVAARFATEAQDVEPRLREIIARLLERDRALRYQTAGDVASDLRRLRRDLTDGRNTDPPSDAARQPALPTATPPSRGHTRLRSYSIAAVAAVIVLAAASVAYWARKPVRAGLPLQVVPFSGVAGMEDDLAFSPDGKQAAFSWNAGVGSDFHIYVKLIGAGPPLPLTSGPGFDSCPAWSPDGRYVAFTHTTHSAHDVVIVSALGGSERKITSIVPVGPDQGSRALTWTPDGAFLLVSDRPTPNEVPALFAVSVASGEKRRLTSPAPAAYGDGDPQFSPDGGTLAFLRWTANSVSDIYLQRWPRGEPRRLTTEQMRISGFAWAADGASIVVSWRRTGTLSALWRIPAEGGAPEPVAATGVDVEAPAIARHGELLAYTYQLENTNIWRMPLGRSGRSVVQRVKLIASPRQQSSSVYSPDGTHIAFASDRSGSSEVWVCDSDGSHPVQLTSLGSLSGTPHWSPDGKWIAFDSRVTGRGAVFLVSAEGGEPRRLTQGPSDDIVSNWSHDGKHIYFSSNRTGSSEIWEMAANGGTPTQVTHNGGFEVEESADGRWLYYSKAVAGIWRRAVAGGEETLLLSRTTGRYWNLAGDQLYFIDMLAAPNPTVNVLDTRSGRVVQLATLDKSPDWGDSGLSVSPDGRWLIWSQMDDLISRILLLRNFR